MVSAVFDTTVFMDAFLGDGGASSLISWATRRPGTAGYSPVTIYELWLQDMSRTEQAFHQSVLMKLHEIAFVSSAAIQVAIWLRRHTRSTRLQRAADAMIAATAASLGATIYTRNPRDFTRFYADVQSY
jgi:predicted nucleic acid-binding protein